MEFYSADIEMLMSGWNVLYFILCDRYPMDECCQRSTFENTVNIRWFASASRTRCRIGSIRTH
jgi:hypothetical protein